MLTELQGCPAAEQEAARLAVHVHEVEAPEIGQGVNMAVGNLNLVLAPHVRRLGLGEVFLSRIDVILADVTVVEPDLVYLDAARLGRVSDRAIEGPPTLAIEVLSPSTAAADRGVKLQLSAKYGVSHYWVVDPDARLIETYRLASPTYEPGPRLDGPMPVALPPFPDLLLDPASVWR
jgi:Uma2 family endonuclease